MFAFGAFVVLFSIPTMALFPNAYMTLANSFLPDESSKDLIGWLLLGLVGVIIGAAVFAVGVDAL